METPDDDKPLKGMIDKFLRAYNLDGRMDEMNIVNNWEELVGLNISNRTKKVSIKNRMLYIELDSAVMREELKNHKSLILQKVNTFAGKKLVDDLWLS
jgi:predicted nucleic acid-binding Zn ribbon protein